MKKPYNKFSVFRVVDRDYGGNGVNQTSRSFVGTTWAKSEAQAVQNVAYRTGTRAFSTQEMWGDGLCTVSLVAEEAKDED